MSENIKNSNEQKDGTVVESMTVEECEAALDELERELGAYSAAADKETDEPRLSTAAVFEKKVEDFKELDGEKAPDGEATFAFTVTTLPEESEKASAAETENTSSTVTCFDDNELFIAAARIVVEEGVVSTSYLQRRLQIGYARAVEIVNRLEELAIVSPVDGNRARRVIVSPERLEKILSKL